MSKLESKTTERMVCPYCKRKSDVTLTRYRTASPRHIDVECECQTCGEVWQAAEMASDEKAEATRLAVKDKEADRLASEMDMSPEGYVREWIKRGRQNVTPLEPWEHAYQRAGLIEQAERKGYLRISRDVKADVTLEPLGEALL